MANETMTLISTITVGAGGSAWIDFLSIPQTYTDLVLFISGRSGETGTGASEIGLYLNGKTYPVSTANFRRLQGDGASALSANSTNYIGAGFAVKSTSTANTFGNNYVYIPNYTGSTAKSVSIDSVTENNGTTGLQAIVAAIDTVTAAITRISLETNSNWQQYSSISLYGILKGSGGATVA